MTHDPLGYQTALDEAAAYPVLGKRLVVRSNSPAVIAAAARSFGHWRGLEPDLVEKMAPLIVEIVVQAGGQLDAAPLPLVHRLHGDTLVAAAGSNLLTAQLDRGLALAFVTPAALADELFFRPQILEALALTLATWHYQDRLPLHAAAVVHDGAAVVLAGPSGAGKSTLCYAAWRAGFRLLAEDAVYVSRRHGLRIWGNPASLHLLADGRDLFPELADLPVRRQANGELKLTVDCNQGQEPGLALHAERAVLCLLEQGRQAHTELLPVCAEQLAGLLGRDDAAGGGIHAHATPGLIADLAAAGAHILRAGRDLDAAVAVLRELAAAAVYES